MDLKARLSGSPELLPFAIDPSSDRVELRALQPVDYEKASFLDARLSNPAVAVMPYRDLADAAASLPITCDFIFHIGHAGSTLLSRLLGQHPSVFSLREPLGLRAFTDAERAGRPWDAAALDARLRTFLSLYSRTWRPEQRALIKATSGVGEIAGRLMRLAPGARAVVMTLQAPAYLATILGGPNSRLELAEHAPTRALRLRRRFPDADLPLEGLSEGEGAAMSWVCEMAGLAAATSDHGDRIAWIDFDALLRALPEGLAGVLTFLRGPDAGTDARQLARSPYVARYSKAPEYAYGPQVRADTLAAARREHTAEIDRGLAWIDRARGDPHLAPVFLAADSAIPRT